MNSIVDLRSDTVTRPCPGMRAAIAGAEVGDDVLGDDPTVLRLQERVAAMFRKPSALFVPTGTMANQVAIRAVCEPGDEIILDDTTHSYNYETGATAALAGCSMRIIHGRRGIYTAAEAEALIRPDSFHFPHTRMVIVENTNNRGGGSLWPTENIAALHALTRQRGLHMHIDGARLMNACVATGRAPHEFGALADSVSMCFSKGLGAPIGSIVVGEADFIRRAHRFRKMYGGGMRQAGVLAAAALYALDHNIERLAEDHANARRFAEQIAGVPGLVLDPKTVETNIVIYDVEPRIGTGEQLSRRLQERGVRILAIAPQRMRAVTHLDVSREQVERAAAIVGECCGA